MAEVIGLAVALVLVVTQLVVDLQVGTLPERFAVEGTEHVAFVVRWGGVIAGGEVGGVLTGYVLHAVQINLIVRGIAVLAVAHAALNAQGDIAASRVQPAIELQHGPCVFVLAIGEAGAMVVVDHIGIEG